MFARLLALLAIFTQLALPVFAGETIALGVVSPVPSSPVRTGMLGTKKKQLKTKGTVKGRSARKASPRGKLAKKKAAATKKPASPLRPPQHELNNMAKQTLAPGVVLRRHRGALNINILDVDLKSASVDVKPVLAGNTFNRLDEVRDQAARVNAIAAINANYLRRDGTPLGTLIMDGEWLAGPLYNRISMGITGSGDVFIDTPNLHGTLETSNPEVPSLWVNNINQPRRSGAKVVLYTRRWGQTVKLPYAGTLIAVDADGVVVGKSLQVMNVPFGGYVLSDSRSSDIAKLKTGDCINLSWHTQPQRWQNVVHAISGGPCLIRNGKLFVDLKGEHFRKNWTSSTIHARTAAGITRDKHLILVTVEGPHTLWDVAKLFKELGCVDAMNLDGGGSTTMVVNGDILTRNAKSAQRRVAATLAVVPRSAASTNTIAHRQLAKPSADLTDLSTPPEVVQDQALADPAVNALTDKKINQAASELMPKPGLSPDLIEPATTSAEVPAEPNSGKSSKVRKIRRWLKHIMP